MDTAELRKRLERMGRDATGRMAAAVAEAMPRVAQAAAGKLGLAGVAYEVLEGAAVELRLGEGFWLHIHENPSAAGYKFLERAWVEQRGEVIEAAKAAALEF